MSFSLVIKVQTEDGLVSLDELMEQGVEFDLQEADGFIVPLKDGTPLYDVDAGLIEADPIISLVGTWMQKMPWLIGGDEETVTLRNSAAGFCFSPVASSVSFGLYEGDDVDLDSMIFDPVTISFTEFFPTAMAMGNQILEWADDNMAEEDEEADLQELRDTMKDVKDAWNRWKRER